MNEDKKKPIIIIAMILGAFTVVAFLSSIFSGGITGATVYAKLSSVFSGNTLSTIGGPLVILTIIISISVVALNRMHKA